MLKYFLKIFIIIFISLILFSSPFSKNFATSNSQQLKDLINIIEKNDQEKKIAAINKIGKLKSSESITYLIDLMNNTKEENQIRVAAVRALGKTGDVRAIDPILYVRRHEDISFFIINGDPFAEALRDIGDPVIGLLIFRLKNSSNKSKRIQAAYLLGLIGGLRAVEPLLEALYDKDQDVYNSACIAIGDVGKPAIKPLIIILNGNNKKLKLKATMLLGGIGGKEVVEPLIGVLEDENPKVRYWAAYALSRAGDKSTIESIAKLLNDENPIVREVAIATIEVLEGKRESVPFTKIEWKYLYKDSDVKPFPEDYMSD